MDRRTREGGHDARPGGVEHRLNHAHRISVIQTKPPSRLAIEQTLVPPKVVNICCPFPVLVHTPGGRSARFTLGDVASSGTVARCDELFGDLLPHLSALLVERVFLVERFACEIPALRHYLRHDPPPLNVQRSEQQVTELPAVDLRIGPVTRTRLPVAEDGPARVQDAHGLPLGTRQRLELRQQPRLVQRALAQPCVQVQRAARGARVGGRIAFEDGDGVTVAAQDTGEGKTAGTAPDHRDALSHVDTLY